MYKVYAHQGWGSVVVEALLEEAKAPYQTEIVERTADGELPESYLRINPLGQIPAIVLPDGTLMTESGAITLYLADQFPKLGFAPALGSPERGAYLRWLVYLAANIYMTGLRVYYPDRYTADQNGGRCVKSAAVARMAREWDIYAKALGDKPYILGEKISAADLYAAMLATWNLDVPAFFTKHPNLKAMYDRVTARPAIAKVWKRSEMESWKA